MRNSNKSRYTILLVVILLYLVPIMLMSSYGRLYMPQQKAWNFLVFGLFCCSVGTLGLFWMMCRLSRTVENQREEEIEKTEITSTETLKPIIQSTEVDPEQLKALEELRGHYASIQEQLSTAQEALEAKNQELQCIQHEYQTLQQQMESSKAEDGKYKLSIQGELEQQKKLLADSQKTISDQREDMDKKLQQIAHLETKVSDLTYEIKTLIQLAEIENQSTPIYQNLPMESSSPGYSQALDIADDDIPFLPEKMVRNEAQAAIQLKRCIDIAQKITGAGHYNNTNSRFKDLTVDNYTLDLRRLFESLRMENASAVVFYSRKESKILFVNNQSRQLLGWSPDKFVQSFNDIVEPSKEIWRQGIASLAIKNDAYVCLKMKSKAGSQVDVQALLGIIPTGIFRHHILGVLYTQTT